MKQYITTEEAVKHCNEEGTLIPSGFLASIPNCLGVNLCSVKGFEVDMTEDGQYKGLFIDFTPTKQ